MVLTIRIHQDVDLPLFPLIEKMGPMYLPVESVPASKYYCGYTLAAKLNMSPNHLLYLAYKSDSIHAIELPGGAFYLHPKGINKFMRKRFKKMLAKMLNVC